MAKKKLPGKSKAVRKPSSPKKRMFDLSAKTWLIIAGVFLLLVTWYITSSSNTSFRSPAYYVYIQRGTDIDALSDTLSNREVVFSSMTFKWMASMMNISSVRPGMYRFEKGWGNYHLLSYINEEELRPTQLVDLAEFRSRKRTVNELGRLAGTDETELWDLLKDHSYVDRLGGFTTESVYCIFRPGRYRLYKKMSAEEVLEYMYCQYVQFWNEKRQARCKELDLTEDEVVILASIVYSETKLRSEMANIAGVYINRLHGNMRLESDPTVLFASTKMDSRRVNKDHLTVESEYNTYRKKGLPPGPICIVPAFVIDEVLKYDKHGYYYFCAKDDMSGCHVFSENFTEHKANAGRYRKALNKKKIYR